MSSLCSSTDSGAEAVAAAAAAPPPAAAPVQLEHVPAAKRLLHAVAVVLQGQSFPIGGRDLQWRLERLLGIEHSSRHVRSEELRRELLAGCAAAAEDGCELPGELLDDEVEDLVLQARAHSEGKLGELCSALEREHGATHAALRAFARQHGELRPGALALVDLEATHTSSPSSGLPVARWAPALASLELPPGGAPAALELLAGSLRPRAPLPLALASLRLHGLAPTELWELRQRFARQRSLQRAMEAPGSELSLAAFTSETGGLEGQDKDRHSEVSRVLFEACDANHNELVDQAELQLAFSAVAPPASLARLRAGVLLQWGGNWRSAMDALKLCVDEGVTAGTLVALAATFDVGHECAEEAFRRLDAAGAGCLSWAELMHRLQGEGEGFTLQELALRAWAACDSGSTPAEQLQLPSLAAEAQAPLAAEGFVAALSITGCQFAALTDGGAQARSGKRKPTENKISRPVTPQQRPEQRSRTQPPRPPSAALPASPPLTEGELLVAYQALRKRYGSVSLAALHAELNLQHLCCDVLAIDRAAVAPGETVLVRYRVPREDAPNLGQKPFIAAVPSKMVWMPGGGGCWTINRQAMTSMGVPKAFLEELKAHGRDHFHGVLRLHAPGFNQGHGRGSAGGCEAGEAQEFRIFASPDGVRFGKQVGGAARFELRLPAPERPILAMGSLEPTSLQLLWEAPAGVQGSGGKGGLEDAYVLRGRPVGLQLEETLPAVSLRSSAAWSHRRRDIACFHCHEVKNLVPGLVYEFEVALLHQTASHEPAPSSAGEASAAPERDGQRTPRRSLPGPSSGAVSKSPSPRASQPRGSSLSLSPSPRPESRRRGSDDSSVVSATGVEPSASSSPRQDSRPLGLESLPSPALEVTLPPRPQPPSPGRPQLAERRPGGELLLCWVEDSKAVQAHIAVTSPGKTMRSLRMPSLAKEEFLAGLPSSAAVRVGLLSAVDFELFWDLSPLALGEGWEDQAEQPVMVAGDAVWPCPAPHWLRRLGDGTVECLVQLPVMEVPRHARFRVLARDLLGGEATEEFSEPSEAIPLPNSAEAVLRDATGISALGRAAASVGGLERLLEAMEDTGILNAGDHLEQRGLLMAKVEEAGGLEAFNGALEGISMPAFARSTTSVRRICGHGSRDEDHKGWETLTRLVEEGGGAHSVAHGLDGLDMRELADVGGSLRTLGFVRASGSERPGLLRDRQQAAALGELARGLDGTSVSVDATRELGGALAAMAHAGGSGEAWASLARAAGQAAGGPAVGAELLAYAGKAAKDLKEAIRALHEESRSLVDFLQQARAAELLGPSADHWARQGFLSRVGEAGGASVLYRALEGMDLKTLRPAMEVVRTAGLHHISCLNHGVGEPSRAELWLQLATAVEREWGGVSAALGRTRSEAAKQRAAASQREESDALLRLAERSGGMAAATRLLEKAAFAGGADRVLEDLGSAADLGRAAAIIARLRRGGGSFEDLEGVVDLANDAGGMGRFVRQLQKTDASRLGELLEHGEALEKAMRGPVPDAHRGTVEECTTLLSRVMADMSPAAFLQGFAGARLPSIVKLLPLLAPAGLLRKRGYLGTEQEVFTAAEAFLRWLARAGGVARMGLAVTAVEPRHFSHLMDLVRSSGLGRLPVSSFGKVADWLAHASGVQRGRHSAVLFGGLEELIDALAGSNLQRLADLLGRVEANERGLPEPTTGQPPPESSASKPQLVLDALASLASSCGGSARLLQLHRRVDHVRRLELALDLLAEAGVLRGPGTSPAQPPEEIQEAFQPWLTVVRLVHTVGGIQAFGGRAEALRQPYLEELFEVLRAAGLVGPSFAVLGDDRPGGKEDLRREIAEWHRVVGLVASGGGPGLFLQSLEGIDVRDVLQTVGLLRRAGLARAVRDAPPDGEAATFDYADGSEADGRVRGNLLQCFVEKVLEAGGFHVFWHALRRVDLSKLQADLHCLDVIRRKICESSQEDLWHVVTSPDRLESLLHTLSGRSSRDELTPKQIEKLSRKLRSIGGIDAFLERYADVDLAVAAPQLRALEENGLSSPQAIQLLARIGQVVHFKEAHLSGMQQVVATLWQWGTAHYGSDDCEALWEGLNQQMSWLLAAMEVNGSLVRTSQRLPTKTKKDQDLTPARLAQFLQALRPIGGVQGFLAAFRGLDLATAAVQARVLHDACVRSVDTARRLAGLYRHLHGDAVHLRGLEQLVRSFCAPVLADAAADKLRAAERWQRLSESLAAAAGKAPAPALAPALEREESGEAPELAATKSQVFSGADHALDVIALGMRLSDAAGLAARPEEWAELCSELRTEAGGLAQLLARLRAGGVGVTGGPLQLASSARPVLMRQRSATLRPKHMECRRCGARMDYHVPRSKSSSALD